MVLSVLFLFFTAMITYVSIHDIVKSTRYEKYYKVYLFETKNKKEREDLEPLPKNPISFMLLKKIVISIGMSAFLGFSAQLFLLGGIWLILDLFNVKKDIVQNITQTDWRLLLLLLFIFHLLIASVVTKVTYKFHLDNIQEIIQEIEYEKKV